MLDFQVNDTHDDTQNNSDQERQESLRGTDGPGPPQYKGGPKWKMDWVQTSLSAYFWEDTGNIAC